MLGKRLITAAVLIIILLLAVFWFNRAAFAIFLSLVTIIGAWEWALLAGFNKSIARAWYCLFFSGISLVAYFSLQEYWRAILLVSFASWILALFMICAYPKLSGIWTRTMPLSFIGILVLFPCWFALLLLRDHEQFTAGFLSLIALVAAADSGAYFSGRKLGKHKLAVLVSPNKTWEGVVGGLLACVALTGVLFILSNRVYEQPPNGLFFLILPFVISSFSVTGDLFESMVKRMRGVKDSGSLLPGHGGILDRIDGIVAAAPVFVLMLFFFTR